MSAAAICIICLVAFIILFLYNFATDGDNLLLVILLPVSFIIFMISGLYISWRNEENSDVKVEIGMEEGLKPCPFCGMELEAKESWRGDGSCSYLHPANNCFLADDEDSIVILEEKNIDLWNMRATKKE